MRLLHTSDWHIGVTTRGVSRAVDQQLALDETVEIGRDFGPDLIVHSGDLFHQPRPQVDELKLAWSGLRRLAELAPVVVIAGNHDSPQWFDMFATMLDPKGPIHFVGQPKSPAQGGILKFHTKQSETLKLACLPFVHAHRMLSNWDIDLGTRLVHYSDRIMRLQRAYAEALQKGYNGQRDILLFSAHLFVDGASLSTSERSLHVSDTYATRASSIPPVSYAAFGHIHKPQPLPGGAPGRYAGSLVPIDFGEENDQKEVVLVEARPGQSAQVRCVPLQRGRKLITLDGSKPELEAQAPAIGEALLRLRVRLNAPDPSLSDWARRVFSDAELVEVSEIRPQPKASAPRRAVEVDQQRSLSAFFGDYVDDMGLGSEGQELARLLGSLEEADKPPVLPELKALEKLLSRA